MQRQAKQDVLRPETIEATSLSAELLKLEQMLNDVGLVDSAHVEAIKVAISEGRFQVDSEVVADELLRTVRERLPRRHTS
jgi:negative regulator of flagellin synthesis FlgM